MQLADYQNMPQTAFCISLTNIELPNGIKYINSSAFTHCTSLTSIIIPSSVLQIGDDIFSGCSNLNELHLRVENPEDIKLGKYAFRDLENCILFVPIGTGYAYRHDERFKMFKEVKIEK